MDKSRDKKTPRFRGVVLILLSTVVRLSPHLTELVQLTVEVAFESLWTDRSVTLQTRRPGIWRPFSLLRNHHLMPDRRQYRERQSLFKSSVPSNETGVLTMAKKTTPKVETLDKARDAVARLGALDRELTDIQTKLNDD